MSTRSNMASGAKRHTRGSTAEQTPGIGGVSSEESDPNIRRSSRRKTGKSALELLGVSPRRPKAVKSPQIPAKGKNTKDGIEKGKADNTTPKKDKPVLNVETISKKPEKITRQSSVRSKQAPKTDVVTEKKTKAPNGKEILKEPEPTQPGERSKNLRPKTSPTQDAQGKHTNQQTQGEQVVDNPPDAIQEIPSNVPSSENEEAKEKEEEEQRVSTENIISEEDLSKEDTQQQENSKQSESSTTLELAQQPTDSKSPTKRSISPQHDLIPPKKRKTETFATNSEILVEEVEEQGPLQSEGIESQDQVLEEVELRVEANEVLSGTTIELSECVEAAEGESTSIIIENTDEENEQKFHVEDQYTDAETHEDNIQIENDNLEAEESIELEETVTSELPDDEETSKVAIKPFKRLPPSRRRKKKSKKIVKAVIITPSGERKEVKLGPHVSTVKALEHILAGTTSGTAEDVAQLAEDVNKQIQASMLDAGAEGENAPSELEGEQQDQIPKADQEGAEVSIGQKLAGVDSDHKMAYEALTQLANGNSKDLPVAIELGNDESVDTEWLQQQGFQVVSLENEDQVWRRQMVGVQDKSVAASCGGLRARPEKHVVASYDLQKMINNLRPDDDISNHIYRISEGGVNHMLCKHCDAPITDRHNFRRHMTSHKDVEFKPWKCPICHYRAAVRAQIARHVNIHGELKPYVCKECGKGFNFKQKLVQHIKYHLDIRDKPCPFCDLAFHEHKTLKNHIRKIHNVTPSDETENPEADVDVPVPVCQEDTVVHQEADESGRGEQEQEGGITESCLNPIMRTKDIEVLEVMPPPKPHIIVPRNVTRKAKKRTRRPSLLYGTRKTFLYTQQYKMGLVPAADRNNVPASIKLPETPTEETSEVHEEEVKTSPKSAGANKVSSAFLLDSVLENYCRMEQGGGAPVSFHCKLCTIEPFSSRTGFVHHLEQKHPEVRAWKCSTCDYSCRMRSSLIVHMKLHTGVKDYHCELCGKSFAFKQKLKNHMKHHLNLREFSCDLCNKAFNEKNDLTKHIRKVHVAERHCVCEVCNKAFKDVIQLRRHAEGHSNDTKKYLCQHCNKYYRSKVSLAQHMKSHTCMFHCEICDKNFGSYSGFMAHKVMHDESFEGYECEICKKILHTKGSLTRHLAVAHSNDRPFSCNDCTKCFKTKKDLKNHKIVHTTERKFSCEYCDFSSKRLESLRVHQRRHAEVKPYQCGICGKEYTQKHALETHLRHHTGHMEASCPICGREFFTRYQLDTHLKRKHPMYLVHREQEVSGGETVGTVLEGEEPVTVFMCEECNAVFMTQDSLAVHILAEHMKQGWGNGAPSSSSTSSSAAVTEVGLLQAPNNTGHSLDESSIANTVEVMTESEGMMTSGGTDQGMSSPTDFSEQTIELVSISEPGSSKQRLVSLIRPVETREEPSTMEDITDTMEAHPDMASAKVTALLDAASGEHDTFVAIADPSSNQEMLVAMPHPNFESLLAATEVENPHVETYIDTAAENYITVTTTDGEIAEGNFVISEESVEGGGRLVAMTTTPAETEEEQQNYVAVAETIEIPIETESVTVLETKS